MTEFARHVRREASSDAWAVGRFELKERIQGWAERAGTRVTSLAARFDGPGRVLGPYVGPALIVVATLAVLRHYAFQPRVESGDMATYWLPLDCFMGRALKSGHIPGWDPFAMSGMPFAPDPQAGWMSLPAMAFFWLLGCGAAIRWLLVALTAATGLGLYWFLRGEGVSRLVATIGGVVLAVTVASSAMPPTYRFPGAIAFTVLLLGATGRFVRASNTLARVGWLLVAALCFGQLAAAYLGLGTIIGIGTLLAYLGVTLVPRIRSGQWTIGRAMVALAALGGVSIVVNAAYLLPRLVYTPRTSVGLGYLRLTEIARAAVGKAPPYPGPATGATWPLNLSLVPGRYMGGVLILVFAGLWSSRRRLAWAFAGVGLLCYLASLQVVVDHVPRAIWSVGVVDQYLHRPHRATFGVFIPAAVLSALGVEAWQRTSSLRTRLSMLAPGIVVWAILPLVLRAPPRRLAFFIFGAAAALVLLAIGRRVPVAALALAPILAAELVASNLFVRQVLTFEPVSRIIRPLPYPRVDVGDYLTATPIARDLRESDRGRYLTIGRSKQFDALQTNQGILYGIESTGGYLSVQLARYWLFIRQLSDVVQGRQYAFFEHPPPVVLDLLQVNWLVVPKGQLTQLEEVGTTVLEDHGFVLVRRSVTVPRASAILDWRVVGSQDEARKAVAAEGFDPERTAILEADPGVAPAGAGTGATVTYTALGPQAARVEVDATAPAIVLIRNVYDPNWHALLDGKQVPLLAVDSVVQGVAVTPGRHTIELRYDDPTIGIGMLVSGVSLVALGVVLLILWRRRSGDRKEMLVR
jgi:hypothetical protein